MRRWRGAAVLFSLCLLAWAPARAEEDASGQHSLYQQALQSLSEGRKGDASVALKALVEREPLHAGAWLDLALIQCALGHADEAERLFATVETRFDPSRELLELIANARATGCARRQPATSATFALGRGIDQNVNQGASSSTFIVDRGGSIALTLLPDFLPKHDQYTLLSGDATRELDGNGGLGFVQFQLRRNDSLRHYDNAALLVGVEVPSTWAGWRLRNSAVVGLSGLGGVLYQRQLQLQTRLTPPFGLPASTQFSLVGGLSRVNYLTLSNFDATTVELRALLAYRKGALALNASAAVLDDRATGSRPGGDRRGNVLNLMLRHGMWRDSSAELAYTRQRWDSALPYSPDLLIDQVRAQSTHVGRATFSYPMGQRDSVVLEARVVRNRENISIFQYNNRQLQLSWQTQWP